LCGVSTVDDDVLAGSEGCSGRTEPEHGAGDLLRHPDAADRGLRRDRSLYIGLPFAESPIEHFGLDRAGRDTIDADALFGEFQRSRLGKADHGELAGDITTFAPSLAKASAVTLPMPEVPPVIRTVFFSKVVILPAT